MANTTATFSVYVRRDNNPPLHFFQKLTREEVVDEAVPAIEGYFGTRLEKSSVYSWRSTDGRLEVISKRD